jgi:hypothetical protein
MMKRNERNAIDEVELGERVEATTAGPRGSTPDGV